MGCVFAVDGARRGRRVGRLDRPWTLFGLGALATVPIASALARRRPGVVNALGALTWGLVMLPIAFIGHTPTAAMLFFVGGAVWGPYTAVETSALQQWVRPDRQGIVFGLDRR